MAPTPRVIFVRHGETEWSKSGQHTSRTDIALTADGIAKTRSTGRALIGPDRLIHPNYIEKVFVSPRKRAQQTLDLLFETHTEETKDIPVVVTENIREWEYGDYEGLKPDEIRQSRRERGIDTEDQSWLIWRDGCEGGEMPHQVAARLDELIAEIVEIQRKAFREKRPSEILVVAHGHILRAFTMRWLSQEIDHNPQFILDTGGVGVLSYEHNNCNERALCLGGAFSC